MNEKILVVDDEKEIADLLEVYQEANNKEWRLPAHLQYRRKPFYVMNLLVL